MSQSPSKVLILSIKAGAGHLRAAQALETVFAEKHPHLEVCHLEALQYTNKAFQKAFTGTYEKLAKDLPSVWGYLYESLERKSTKSRVKKLNELFDRANAKGLRKEIEAYKPDAIVCTHYFPAEIATAMKRKGKITAPIYVTLTDYDIHTMWIQEGVDHYFVASEEMAFALREKGIGTAGVTVSGIPVMPVFAKSYPDRSKMRKRLGLKADVPTVLSSAGGFGLGGVDKTVASLAESVESVQILAIAGKNSKLEKALQKVAAKTDGRVVPYGFVDNMHELMAASDLAVTKPGGLTSSECLALGLPMLILQPIPGQEERNSDFLLEAGTALKSNSTANLLYKFRYLMTHPERLEQLRKNTAAVAKPYAAYTIAELVAAG